MYVCMCRRDTEPERRRVKKEVKRQREGRSGRDAETSRTGKITHFDGIKMSVFPSPISMEIAHLWRAKERKGTRGRERKREREREREPTDFCLSYTLCGGLSERWCVASWIGQRDCQISGNSLFGFGPRNVVSSLLLIFARRLARLQ